MAELWSMAELLAATGGRLEGEARGPFTGVSIDSRSIAPGEIFIAIKGDSRDGHEFAAAALQMGARLAIVSAPTDEMRAKGALLVVDEPLAALRRMAAAARSRSTARIIAVTGSVGKTGTKEALRLVLGSQGETHASQASYNNHWGVPLSLARLPRSARYAVFEIGMNHAGEITPLTQLVKPEIAIITTIAPGHFGHFRSLDEIADAKAEIFSGVVPGGAALEGCPHPWLRPASVRRDQA
jgi:UDP-N-acetylmuramoyl-tripeptide--D-alanyl-D-alanine ligase